MKNDTTPAIIPGIAEPAEPLFTLSEITKHAKVNGKGKMNSIIHNKKRDMYSPLIGRGDRIRTDE